MSKQKTLGVFSVAVAMMFSSCGPVVGGNGNGGGGGGGAVTLEEFLRSANTSVVEGLCASAYDCAEPSFEVLNSGVGRFPDKSACLESLNGLDGVFFSREVEVVAQGRMTYDADAAATCLAAIREFPSDPCGVYPPSSLNSACDAVFLPAIALGGNCESSDECIGDARCESDGDVCYGTCVSNLRCGEGECAEGEYCGYDPDTDSELCFAKLKAGDACDFDSDCTLESPEVECLTDEFGDNGICTAYGTLGAGDYCDFEDAYCGDGLECSFDTVQCEAVGGGGTIAKVGEACNIQSSPCEAGSACVDLDVMAGGVGTCGALKGDGEECVFVVECAAGLTCKNAMPFNQPPSKGTCVVPAALGESCSGDGECSSNKCDFGTCVEREVCQLP